MTQAFFAPRRFGLAASLLVLAGLSSAPAFGGEITLSDGNSTAVINTQSQAGMHTWNVDGVDQMYQQWFWIRVGNQAETSIDQAWVSDNVSDVNGNGQNDTLFATFQNALWRVTVQFALTGGTLGSRISDMAETIRVTNISGRALDFSFFQYTDFDLNGSPGGDAGVHVNANTFRQTDTAGGTVAQEVALPTPSRWEMGPFATILDKLNDGAATNLSNGVSPTFGDVTFAFQWDFRLANGGSFIISKDKLITAVPEPASVVSLGFGLFAIAAGGLKRLAASRGARRPA
ncbi:hypothetical protein [Paludisphaera soli]|uniref:hypothetical protein n=1 Tax=Paludisphaera soli TaxID=2712865 RepID=UPI0013EA5995|nr:hypothetical protein [Paludisphaera soli]